MMAQFSYWQNSMLAGDVLKRLNEFSEDTAGYLIIEDIGGLANLHKAMNKLVSLGWRAVNMFRDNGIVFVLMFREPPK